MDILLHSPRSGSFVRSTLMTILPEPRIPLVDPSVELECGQTSGQSGTLLFSESFRLLAISTTDHNVD